MDQEGSAHPSEELQKFLHWRELCDSGTVEQVEHKIMQGIDVNQQFSGYSNALEWLGYSTDPQRFTGICAKFKLLLRHGANPGGYGPTP